jgi:hypothetical protein
MRALDSLPVEDPGTPNLTSPGNLLRWVAWKQRRILFFGVLWGTVWMFAQATVPAALGGGINATASHDKSALLFWSLVVLALGITQAAAGILRHRMAVSNWITGASRIQQLVARRASAATCRARWPPVRWSRSPPTTSSASVRRSTCAAASSARSSRSSRWR